MAHPSMLKITIFLLSTLYLVVTQHALGFRRWIENKITDLKLISNCFNLQEDVLNDFHSFDRFG